MGTDNVAEGDDNEEEDAGRARGGTEDNEDDCCETEVGKS